jgi:hypothetical protein
LCIVLWRPAARSIHQRLRLPRQPTLNPRNECGPSGQVIIEYGSGGERGYALMELAYVTGDGRERYLQPSQVTDSHGRLGSVREVTRRGNEPPAPRQRVARVVVFLLGPDRPERSEEFRKSTTTRSQRLEERTIMQCPARP